MAIKRQAAISALCAISSLLASASSLAADGLELPATWTLQSEIDEKQVGYTTVSIDEDGKVTASTLFSNGKTYDGDHFITQVIVYAAEDVPILGMQYGVGINPSYGFGGAKEETVGRVAEIEPEFIDDIVSVGILHRTEDTIDDQEVWETIGKIAEAVWKAYSESGNSGEGGFSLGGSTALYHGASGVVAGFAQNPAKVVLPKAALNN